MSGRRRNRGAVIAISGMESSGKSTQIDSLIARLNSRDLPHVYLWTRPGYTPGIQAVKRLFRRSAKEDRGPVDSVSQTPGAYPKREASFRSGLHRWAWLTIALLDLFWTYALRIRWQRARGRVVLVDRYLLDAIIDFRINFPKQHVERRPLFWLIRKFAVRPDVSLLLAIPAAESAERTRNRQRHHWETLELLSEKEELYQQVAEELHVEVIDGCQPAETVSKLLNSEVDASLALTATRAQVDAA